MVGIPRSATLESLELFSVILVVCYIILFKYNYWGCYIIFLYILLLYYSGIVLLYLYIHVVLYLYIRTLVYLSEPSEAVRRQRRHYGHQHMALEGTDPKPQSHKSLVRSLEACSGWV